MKTWTASKSLHVPLHMLWPRSISVALLLSSSSLRVCVSHCLASAASPENNCRTWCNGDPSSRRKQTRWKPLRSHAIRDHCCNYRARFSPAKTCTSSPSVTHRRRTATRRSTLGFTGCGSGQASSRCRFYSTLNSCCGNALSYVFARPRAC